ncbi:hypothetical protein U9M48_042923 [Paspalum notatum var. saurae]|uniref:Uncharacterized protein n=1 Tax=Paspalum notatum var. saurae TaxID=547442 RepID=A0AAQ3USE0_PASNO
MWEEFNEVFQTIGWSDFAEILEGGIILLTKEFLMTLRTDTRRDGTYIWFCLFNTDYELTLRQFSNLLDFSPQCTLSEDVVGFNSAKFWKELLESEPEPGRNSISGVMTRAQQRRAEEQNRKANEDAQQPGTAPAWAHPSTPAWEANPQGSWHSSWNSIVPSTNPTPSYHSEGEYSCGHGAGPFHSARYTGGKLDGNFTALFGALDLQEHRTLGMMDSLADIQQQQGVDHNLILETRTTVDRTHE